MSSPQQRRFFKLIHLEEALRLMHEAVQNRPIECENVETVRSLGRVLAENIVSEVDLPNHDYAAMDGYAVRASSVKEASQSNPVRLTVTGELHPPDHPTNRSIADHEAVYVACGAPIPKRADAVLRVEHADKENEEIIVKTPLEQGRNICHIGEDLKRNELVLAKNRLLRPQDIGLLVALNRKYVNVTRRPRVAILSVGDELIEPFKDSQNKTINDHAYIVSSLVEYFGGEPVLIAIARDNVEDISRKITSAMEKADLVITIAGCSVGVRDYVPDAIRILGEPGIVFHGVALSAGKVSGFAVAGSKLIVMLPGHVGSTVAGFYLLVTPLMNMLQGLGFKDSLPTLKCVLDETVRAKRLVDLLLPVKVFRSGAEYHAMPLTKPLSVLKNLVDANGYVIVPANSVLTKGASVDVKLYGALEFHSLAG